MNISLYNISNDTKTVNKKLINTGAHANLIATLSGNLKSDCPIEEPEIELSFSSDYVNANYMYIPAFHRYYFITGKTVSTQRIYLKGFTDVLTSFADGLLDTTCIVERQANTNKANHYLPDKYYMTEQRRLIRTVPFFKGGIIGQFTPSASSFVLTTGGKS